MKLIMIIAICITVIACNSNDTSAKGVVDSAKATVDTPKAVIVDSAAEVNDSAAKKK